MVLRVFAGSIFPISNPHSVLGTMCSPTSGHSLGTLSQILHMLENRAEESLGDHLGGDWREREAVL